jgi:hypothetical protein
MNAWERALALNPPPDSVNEYHSDISTTIEFAGSLTCIEPQPRIAQSFARNGT